MVDAAVQTDIKHNSDVSEVEQLPTSPRPPPDTIIKKGCAPSGSEKESSNESSSSSQTPQTPNTD